MYTKLLHGGSRLIRGLPHSWSQNRQVTIYSLQAKSDLASVGRCNPVYSAEYLFKSGGEALSWKPRGLPKLANGVFVNES